MTIALIDFILTIKLHVYFCFHMAMKKSVKEFKETCKEEKKRKTSTESGEMSLEKVFSSIQRPEDVDPSALVGSSIQV